MNLDDTMKNWSEIRDNLAHYLIEVNRGRHGEVAPKANGVYSIFRRYLQTSIFAELGIASKNEYGIGILLNPTVDGKVTSYAIPVTIKHAKRKGHHPDVRYTTFEYEAWGQAHDQLIHGVGPSPREVAKRTVPVEPPMRRDLALHQMDQEHVTSQFSEGLNSLLMSNLRKYATTPGPHFYNMPLLQATLFDSGLTSDVYRRYMLMWDNKLVGYYVAEVTDNFFTITHCIVDSERLSLLNVTVKSTLQSLLRKMMSEDSTLRFKVLHRSKLLDRYMLRRTR